MLHLSVLIGSCHLFISQYSVSYVIELNVALLRMSRIEIKEQDTSENKHVLRIFTTRSAVQSVLMGNSQYILMKSTDEMASTLVITCVSDELMSFLYLLNFYFVILCSWCPGGSVIGHPVFWWHVEDLSCLLELTANMSVIQAPGCLAGSECDITCRWPHKIN